MKNDEKEYEAASEAEETLPTTENQDLSESSRNTADSGDLSETEEAQEAEDAEDAEEVDEADIAEDAEDAEDADEAEEVEEADEAAEAVVAAASGSAEFADNSLTKLPEDNSRKKKIVIAVVILVAMIAAVLSLLFLVVFRETKDAALIKPNDAYDVGDSAFVSDSDSISVDNFSNDVIGVGVLYDNTPVYDQVDGKEVGKLPAETTLMIYAADHGYYKVADVDRTVTGYVKKDKVNTGGLDIGNYTAGEEIVDDETGEIIDVIPPVESSESTVGQEQTSESETTQSTKKTTTKSTEKTTTKSTEKTTTKSTEKTTTKSTEKSTTKSTEKSTKKSTTKSTEKSTEKPTTKSTEKSTTKSTEKPVTKSTTKTTISTTTTTTTASTTKTTSTTKKKSDPNSPENFPVNASPYFIYVEKGSHTITIYAKDSHGKYTTAVRTYLTATGRTASLTPVGLFSVGGKEKWHRWGSSSFSPYCSRYYGGLFFHGPLYKQKNFGSLKESSVSAIGTNASSGCMRTSAQAAYFVYAFCPSGTYVKIVNGSPLGKSAGRPAIKSQYVDPATNKVPVAGVNLKISSKTVKIGESFTVKAEIEPDNASEKACYWLSSNPKSVIVKGSGTSCTITAKAAGKATVTVTTVDGSYKATITVTVTEPTTTTTTTATTTTTTKSTTKPTETTVSTTKATESTKSTTKATESTKSTTKATESTKSTTKATEEP